MIDSTHGNNNEIDVYKKSPIKMSHLCDKLGQIPNFFSKSGQVWNSKFENKSKYTGSLQQLG